MASSIAQGVAVLWKVLLIFILSLFLLTASLAFVKFLQTPEWNEAIYERLLETNTKQDLIIQELLKENMRLSDRYKKKGICS